MTYSKEELLNLEKQGYTFSASMMRSGSQNYSANGIVEFFKNSHRVCMNTSRDDEKKHIRFSCASWADLGC